MKFPITNDFSIETDYKTQALKVLEESAELLEAVSHESESHQLEEAMDVLQALANLCRAKGWSYSQLLASYQIVELKNRSRGRYGDNPC